ncbi:MAG: glycosyltransferase [Anaerolineales bacterium]|nr:glycosyltransferase [Anaerolineales bacterium]
MLTRFLALSALWLIISSVVTLFLGTRFKHGNKLNGFLWLLTVIVFGDLWAVFTFGEPNEVLMLSLAAMLLGSVWILLLPNWNWFGQTTWTMSILSSALYITYSFAVTAFTPLNPLSFLFSLILFLAELLAIGLSLSYTFEMLDVCTRFHWNHLAGLAQPVSGYIPKVSLQVPAYNEPLEVVEATLRTLAKINYPNFEVLLIDNNTPDEATWRPLESLCKELGPHFKCLHLDKWPGYKSGALNFALTQTDPEAEIIAIIDADYQVQPNYLSELIPYFVDPRVAFVQTPQDYRDYKGNPFLEACYDAYKYFFEVSMPSRNEHNAIIFCGTMGLIRKSVVEEIGGWDEWCITEDAEASLRILKLGYKSIYINQAYGHGIMPLNFESLKKQRFRWCFGGIQVLRKHWESLMPWAHWVDPKNQLTAAQRYYYLLSSLQWFNEFITMGFTTMLVISSIASMLGWDAGVRPLAGAVAVVPLVFLILGLGRFLWALRYRLHLTWTRALLAMGSFFSLSWVVTLASIQGLIQPRGVFLRTSKSKGASNLLRALVVTQWETGIGIACGLTGLFLALSRPPFEGWLTVIFLFWQMSLYLAAPAYSLLSERGGKPVLVTSPGDIDGRVIAETQAARWSAALATLLLIGFFMFRLLPQPTETPNYARLAPAELKPEKIFKVHPVKGNQGKPDKPAKPPKEPKKPKKPRIQNRHQTVHKFGEDRWQARLG